MKKILAVLLALIMVAGLLPFGALAAAPAPTISLTTDARDDLKVGDTFTVTASLANNPGFATLTLSLLWNSAVVEFQGFETEYNEDDEVYELKDTILGQQVLYDDETGKVSNSRSSNSSKTGTIFTAQFKVVGEGKCDIGFNQDNSGTVAVYEFKDIDGNDINATVDVSDVAPLTIGGSTEPTTPTAAYTASISADKTEYTVNDAVTVTIDVGGTEGSFASSEVVLKYDANYLTFDPAAQSEDLGSVSAKDGVISIIDHGNDQADNKYTLTFTAKAAVAETKVILTSAAFDKAADAISENLTSAELGTAEAAMSIINADLAVDLDELMDGTGSVAYGGTYTFTAKDPNYTYELSVNEGAITPEYNEETGVWSIANVTTDLKIVVTKQTAKQFSVTISDSSAINGTPATGENAATYKTDYVFTLKTNVDAGPGTEGYTYSVTKVTIGGQEVANSWSANDRVVTIKGAYITGAIVITTEVVELEAGKLSVTMDDEYPEVTADKTSNITKGDTVTLTVAPVAGYKYTIEVNGAEQTIADNKVVITNVSTNLVVDVTRELDLSADNVSVGVYLALNGKTMYIVQVTTKLDEGSVYTYDGANMFWSGKYNNNNGAYAFLVVTENADTPLSFENAIAKIKIEGGSAMTIDYSGDVNKSAEGKVDANDAQLVWNMYSAKNYTAIDEATNTTGATMEKFLRADVNGSADVDVEDATAIINIIKTRAN